MNKAEKKFLRYAVLAVLVMMVAVLGVINGINFTMAARDADNVTELLATGRGVFGEMQMGGGHRGRFDRNGQLGPMGPTAPDTNESMRYFTIAFPEEGSPETIAFHISAVTEEDALVWAESLRKETTGWTHGTYRYRVYELGGKTYVTVIDQGREMLSVYRILLFSLLGTAAAVLVSFLALRAVGKRLFAPLEDADRKQRKFIAQAEEELKLPLTVIGTDLEIIETETGPTDQTRSIHRQLRKMQALVRRLASFTIFEEEGAVQATVHLSDLTRETLNANRERIANHGLTLTEDIAEGIDLEGNPEAIRQILTELTENAIRYASRDLEVSLRREGERVLLQFRNDTSLPEGAADQVFDRFTTLANAEEGHPGLGLAFVKEAVLAHHGRCSASVTNGRFLLRLDL